MVKSKDSQIKMYDHSKAKVDLFKRYFSIYLNIMHRVEYISTIYLYDLFAGEGQYTDGSVGSPIAAMECIKEHYYSNHNSCPEIRILFNDFSKSQIETDKYKIDRVKELCDKIYKPENVKVEYSKIDSSKILAHINKDLNNLKPNERALLFIDPWGYKEIKPNELKSILSNGKTEMILFLPISFMYRFAEKALVDKDFSGGRPLEEFLRELFGETMPDTKNQIRFIESIKQQFKKYINLKFVDTFTIERDNNSFFCLFFFTSNKVGYHKMLDAKWKFDEKLGRAFEIQSNSKQSSMFDAVTEVDYLSQLEEYLRKVGSMTNIELLDFGLENGFLPKHTKKVLDLLNKSDKIIVESLDGKAVLGYYIDNSTRKISVKIK